MNFRGSETYLLSLGNEVSAMKLGLENIAALLSELGDPQNKFLKVQVAGTNGKGSVCAFLDAICMSAGIRTGLYTSPHLISMTERIRIDGIDIDESDFARHASTVRQMAEDMLAAGKLTHCPTFFEQITAIALVAFAAAGVDVAILETGLGGRLDATTAADAEIAVITPIALDHEEYLGDTIEEIAAEKAAIIHPGSHVVIARQPPEAERVIESRCQEMGVDPVWATTEIMTVKQEDGSLVSTFITPRLTYTSLELGIAGRHQVDNAAAALAAANLISDLGHYISPEDIEFGLETAHHPGRLEYHGEYLFDGAHNAAGVTALCAYLDEFIDEPLTIVFGAMREKDVAAMVAMLAERAGTFILTRPDNSRAMNAAEIERCVPASFDRSNLLITDSVSDALEVADDVCGDMVTLITGSLYLIGEVKRLLKNDADT